MNQEEKVSAMQANIEYLSAKNMYLQNENRDLKIRLYGEKSVRQLHTIAHDVINAAFEVDIDTLSRKKKFVKARRFYYKFLKENTDMSLKGIADTLFLKQDHSSVIHAIKEFDHYFLSNEKDYRKEYRAISKVILELKSSNF